MKLIVITWLPCTGKTTLWKQLSEKYNLPFYSKDAIKEIMFDFIWSKKEVWKEKLSKSWYEILYYILEQNLKTNNNIILESNFIPEFSNKVFNDFKQKYDFDIFQIMCNTKWEVLFKRFKERSFWINRHPWHDDKNNIKSWKSILLKWKIDSLDIWWELCNLDTTDFSKINYDYLYKWINKFLK